MYIHDDHCVGTLKNKKNNNNNNNHNNYNSNDINNNVGSLNHSSTNHSSTIILINNFSSKCISIHNISCIILLDFEILQKTSVAKSASWIST